MKSWWLITHLHIYAITHLRNCNKQQNGLRKKSLTKNSSFPIKKISPTDFSFVGQFDNNNNNNNLKRISLSQFLYGPDNNPFFNQIIGKMAFSNIMSKRFKFRPVQATSNIDLFKQNLVCIRSGKGDCLGVRIQLARVRILVLQAHIKFLLMPRSAHCTAGWKSVISYDLPQSLCVFWIVE